MSATLKRLLDAHLFGMVRYSTVLSLKEMPGDDLVG
jgi:hypothetical protein